MSPGPVFEKFLTLRPKEKDNLFGVDSSSMATSDLWYENTGPNQLKNTGPNLGRMTDAFQWCTGSDLESNPAGYLDFFGLVWISFPFQSDSDYPNEIKCGHARIFIRNNSCMKKNYNISKS